MPSDLPRATPDQRQLAAREGAAGFDTAIAEFFGAEFGTDEDGIPTEIDGGDLGKSARRRAVERSLPKGAQRR